MAVGGNWRVPQAPPPTSLLPHMSTVQLVADTFSSQPRREQTAPASAEDCLAETVATAVVLRLQAQLLHMEQQMKLLVDAARGNSLGHVGPSYNLADVQTEDFQTVGNEKAGLLEIARDDGDSTESSADEHRGHDEDSCGEVLCHCLRRWYQKEEPKRTGALATCVDSEAFSHVTLAVILLNSFFIWQVTNITARMLSSEVTPWLHAGELAFLLYYTCELTLRLVVHRGFFFWNSEWAWNSFDFTIVLLGAFDVLLQMMSQNGSEFDLSCLRMSRILRVTRILRVFKAFKFLTELRLMGACVLGSITSLFWSCAFLFVVLWVAALVMVQSMVQYRMDNCPLNAVFVAGSQAEQQCAQLADNFGNVRSAMLGLFQSTTAGMGWKDLFDVVMLDGKIMGGFFLFFIIFFKFAFFNIVTSMFVNKAMKLAKPDDDSLMAERTQEEIAVRSQLRDLIMGMDGDQDGQITLGELAEAMKDERILHKFDMLGITVRDVRTFFMTLEDTAQTEKLTVDLFLDGCMQMKGPARSLEVLAIRFQVQEILRNIRPLDPQR